MIIVALIIFIVKFKLKMCICSIYNNLRDCMGEIV